MYDRNYRRSPKGRERDRRWQLAHYTWQRRSERYWRLERTRALRGQREAAVDAAAEFLAAFRDECAADPVLARVWRELAETVSDERTKLETTRG
jgi:hypothetical protein